MSITSVQDPQENHSSPLLHLFFEPEHTIKVFTLVIVLFAGLRIMRIRMMAVEEFDDMETAFVDIEMDIPCLEAGSTGLPDFCLRIQAFNFLPGRLADTFAVCPGMDKQQFQLIMPGRFVDLQDKTASPFAVFPNHIGCTVVDTVFYCFSGNDLAVFLKVIVPFSELLRSPVFESILVIKDELFPVILRKPGKSNVCHTKRPPSIKMARQHKAKS